MIKVQTAKLQTIVSKAISGVGNNKLIPITTYLMVRTRKDGDTERLEVVTTDNSDYLIVSDTLEVGGDFRAVVDADTFSKLVLKLNSEYTEMDVQKGVLTITSGRGKYSIGLPIDEDGEVINYPIPYETQAGFDKGEKVGTFEVADTNVLLNNIKPSLALTAEKPWYTGYYMGKDLILATDTIKMGVYNAEKFTTEFLLNSRTANLLPTDEAVDFYLNGDILTCISEHCAIYSVVLSGIEMYTIEKIKALLGSEFDSVVTVAKKDLAQIIERIELFIGEYDGGLITFKFGEDLMISNKASNGVDVVEYIDSHGVVDASINLNVKNIQPIIKANRGDSVTICYNSKMPRALKIVDGDVVSLVSAIVV